MRGAAGVRVDPWGLGGQSRVTPKPSLVSAGPAWAWATASSLLGPQLLLRLRPRLWALPHYGHVDTLRSSLLGHWVALKT